MTDNEIKEILEDCGCPECTAILDLINRQKAEIEALKLINSTYNAETEEIREIAIKEFAVQLKLELYKREVVGGCLDFIDQLVKEKTEGTE